MKDMHPPTRADTISRYCADLGWYLVAIPAGSKAPRSNGWQRPETAITTADAAREYWTANPEHNVGLLHSASGTAAFDVDNVEHTRIIFSEMGIDYEGVMASAPRIVGRKDRGKVLFRVPHGLTLSTHKISWPVEGDPRRTEVVFEMRAGAAQDVLPPSIHPDTGTPYTWAGPSIYDGLPEIPAPLLTLWLEWDRFRGQLQDCCPWKAKPVFMPPRKVRAQGERTSVIDAFNSAHDMRELLTRFNYKPVGRDRFLSPNSSSGLAGVVLFEDGRAYSHHASDPFDSAHTFDAFDLWCQYEHAGDVSKAVRDAGEFLGLERNHDIPDYDPEAIEHGRKVAIQIMGKPKTKDSGKVPDHLLSIPGKLQDAVNLFNSTAVANQPQFAVLAALVLGSTVMGRRWKTVSENYSSCYYVAIGATGCGKEYIRKFILRVLADCNLPQLIGPSGYTSAAGVLHTLIGKPNHVTFIDEFGRKLKQAAGRDNTNAQGMLTALMELFAMQDGAMSPQGYSKAGLNKQQAEDLDKVVRNPSLTLVGMSTGHDFSDAIGYGDVASGFLNRMLIIETDYGIPMPRMVRAVPLGDRLKDWCIECASASAGGDLVGSSDTHDRPPAAIVLDWSDGAIRVLDDITRKIHEYQNANADNPLSAMKSRTREIIMRLSLVVARSCEETEISASSVEWARDFVEFYTDRIIRMIEEKVSINDFHGICNAVIKQVKRSASKGMTSVEIGAVVPSYKALKPREREDVMRVLMEDYGLIKINRNEGKKGRPAMCWLLPADQALD